MSATSRGRMVRLQMAGRELADLDFWTKSDPFLVVSRTARNGDGLVQVRKTETIMNNLNPNWKVLYISTKELCDDDLSMPLQLEVWDEDKGSKHDLIGSVSLSLDQMMELANSRCPVNLSLPGAGDDNRGQLLVTECRLEEPDRELERKLSTTSYPSSRTSSFSQSSIQDPPELITLNPTYAPNVNYSPLPYPPDVTPIYTPDMPGQSPGYPRFTFPEDPTDNRPPYLAG